MNVSGEPLLSPARLVRALRTRARLDALEPLLGAGAALAASGRRALEIVLASSGAGRVLVPAYVCDTVVEGVSAAGWQHRYYPLVDGLQPDWAWLEANRAPADRAIIVVHYFGFPADLERAAAFRSQHDVAVIEDCAHAFLTVAAAAEAQLDGSGIARPMGRTGDTAIYSWRKFMPVSSGGAVIWRAGRMARAGTPAGEQDFNAAPRRYGKALRELAKWALFKAGSHAALRLFGSVLSDETDPTPLRAAVPDRFAIKLLTVRAAGLKKVASARRENYRVLRSLLDGARGLRLLTDGIDRPGDYSVPWCLALSVDDGGRDALLEGLLRDGIGAWAWPDVPHDLAPSGFPREADLAGRTLCLPVHEDLDGRHMRYIARAVNRRLF